ncbi:winged helix-turn-helix transcriptional regulator [Paenibacillus rigui]|uniref:MarR family transcriptional regulator n=1 Tax=Paenibacillus rigui TaxID=554312 RepID=A0A229UH10_9BACL|nr:helix-turn-helix domain-containing protein [Paenibacillus rigui]OXM82686.1 MarR family transcriptional regulator [Paenibacillus rigui]
MSLNCQDEVEATLEVLVGKWKLIILSHIALNKTMRFGEFQKSIPDITKKMLSSQLRDLEYHGIISRKVYNQMPLKVEYAITEYGESLKPILDTLVHWGKNHIEYMSSQEKKVVDSSG